MKRTFFLLFVSIVLWLGSCVEPVNFIAGNRREILIVDGIVSDKEEEQFISLRRAFVSQNTNVFRGISGAELTVVENESVILKCEERNDGNYFLPKGFKGKVGNSYQLKIKMADGKEYQSDTEVMPAAPDIDRVYSNYRDDAVEWKGVKLDGHYIYVDTKDFPDTEDYFSWSWKLFEKQEYCHTCAGGMYFPDPAPVGRCVDYAHLQRQNIIYDYVCDSKCWQIYYSDKFNVMSDVFSTGNKILGREIAQIPFFETSGAVVEVYQHSLTASAYRFFRLMIEQSQNTGTLAETPPAPLVGNIRNTRDKYESVGGYFMASSYKIKQFWLDRKDIGASNPTIYGQFEGRWVNPEPPDPAARPPRPPLAKCLPSKNRTPLRPAGWIDQ